MINHSIAYLSDISRGAKVLVVKIGKIVEPGTLVPRVIVDCTRNRPVGSSTCRLAGIRKSFFRSQRGFELLDRGCFSR